MPVKKTRNGKKGGLVKGPSHEKGGVPVIIQSTKQPIEIEGGEIIINKEASEKHCELLSKINQSAGGGIKIPCSTCTDCDMHKNFRFGGPTDFSHPLVRIAAKNMSKKNELSMKEFAIASSHPDFIPTEWKMDKETGRYVKILPPIPLKNFEKISPDDSIKSIAFERKKFRVLDAKKWMKDNGYHFHFPTLTEKYIYVSQQKIDHIAASGKMIKFIEIDEGVHAEIIPFKQKK